MEDNFLLIQRVRNRVSFSVIDALGNLSAWCVIATQYYGLHLDPGPSLSASFSFDRFFWLTLFFIGNNILLLLSAWLFLTNEELVGKPRTELIFTTKYPIQYWHYQRLLIACINFCAIGFSIFFIIKNPDHNTLLHVFLIAMYVCGLYIAYWNYFFMLFTGIAITFFPCLYVLAQTPNNTEKIIIVASVLLIIYILIYSLRHTGDYAAQQHQNKGLELRSRQSLSATRQAQIKTEQLLFLAAATNHDMKQPITSIRSNLEKIRSLQNYTNPLFITELSKLATRAQYSMEQAYDVLDTLVDYLSFSEQKLYVLPDFICLDEVIVNICQANQTLAEQYTVELIARPCYIKLNSDALLLQRILNNLVLNAIEHSRPQSRVMIVYRRFKHQLEIRDSGCGMTQEKTQSLKNMLNGVSPQSLQTNRGLGLYIVRLFCQMLDIKIDFYSRPSKGTVFFLKLPEMPKNQFSRPFLFP